VERRILALCLVMSCLIVILAAGAGMWGIHQGLIQGPTGRIQLGQLEVMAMSAVEYSTARPPRGYYIVWIGITSEAMPRARPWRPYIWGRRLVRLEVPPPAVLMP
jgi:hypothetical protein